MIIFAFIFTLFNLFGGCIETVPQAWFLSLSLSLRILTSIFGHFKRTFAILASNPSLSLNVTKSVSTFYWLLWFFFHLFFLPFLPSNLFVVKLKSVYHRTVKRETSKRTTKRTNEKPSLRSILPSFPFFPQPSFNLPLVILSSSTSPNLPSTFPNLFFSSSSFFFFPFILHPSFCHPLLLSLPLSHIFPLKIDS